jgi:radical SAM protein with 4Fe4S-binding SPASM domain
MFIPGKRKARIAKLLGLTKLPYLPSILNVEPGNICNLKCPLCPTGAGLPGIEKGCITLELFKKVFDELKQSLTSINLYSWGEPLLNRDLIPIIEYIKPFNKNIRITTSTSLNLKDNNLLAGLINSGIDEIIVSCDGTNQDSYGKYRVGGDFGLVMNNLRLLADKKKELGKDTLITWNFLVFKHNEQEIDKAKEMADNLGVYFRIGFMRTSMKDEILMPHSQAIEKDKDWIPDNPNYSAYDKENNTTKKIIKTCRKPWQEISVNWNGLVLPCCAVYEEKYNFGNAGRNNVKDIWNNSSYVEARKEILCKSKEAKTICGKCKDVGFMHM